MRTWAVGLSAAALAMASDARGYTYQSLVSNGCHERLAVAALRATRTALPALVTVTPSANDRALIHDIPFDLDPDVRDLTGASLAIGVRDNDLHGNGPDELDALAQVHGNPNLQHEHCLRGTLEDEPTGTQAALEDCKEFIRQKVNAALDGLRTDGLPDPTKRESLDVTLMFRGRTSVSLPTYWIEMGRALHAMEDSFTHQFRSSDHMRARVTENYTDYVNGNIVESRDGPSHRAQMDECEGLDAYRQRNFELATQASVDLLKLTLDPANTTRDAKLAALETTLNTYLTYEPGCTFANHWCDAPENGYSVAPGCSIGGRRLADTWIFGVGMTIMGIGYLARRRRRVVAALGFGLAMGCAAEAQAQEPLPAAEPAPVEAPPPPATTANAPDLTPSKAPQGTLTKQEVTAEQKNEEHLSRFALFGAVSGSVSNPSANGQIGGRYNLSERWQVGLDGEINGWLGSITHHLAAGTFNAYGTVVFRTPLRFASFNLRSTASLGVSTLLIDLYGAPAGSTGIFLGFTPLGLEWKVSSRVFIILSGLGIALPIPKLTGAPFAYSQYRESLGVEISL